MKKRVTNGKKFRATEVGALIEAIRFEIKPVLEAIPDIQKKLDCLFEKVVENTEKIEENTGKVEINRVLITRVLEELQSKVDRKEFDVLEKKVASLIH